MRSVFAIIIPPFFLLRIHSFLRDLEVCDLTDEDAEDLAACFDDVGRENIIVL